LNKTAFIEQLTTFLYGADKTMPATPIDLEADLFDLGLLESIRIVELIVFLEQLIGAEIPVEDYQPESFRTLNGIYAVAVASSSNALGSER